MLQCNKIVSRGPLKNCKSFMFNCMVLINQVLRLKIFDFRNCLWVPYNKITAYPLIRNIRAANRIFCNIYFDWIDDILKYSLKWCFDFLLLLPRKSWKLNPRRLCYFADISYLIPLKCIFASTCITFENCVVRIFEWISTEFQCYANWISMRCKMRCMKFQYIRMWLLQAQHATYFIVDLLSSE